MKIVTEITLDLSRQGIQCSVPITQHDAGTRRVVVHLRNGSKPVILNEHDHCVLFFEEDNYDPVTVYTENGTYPNSLVYDLSPNLSLNAGEHQAVFQLFRGVENRTYSPLFVFAVSNDITNSSQVLQSPQYAAVLKAQYAAEQYALQANEDADEANAAMEAAQESAGEAKASEEYVRSLPFYLSPKDVPDNKPSVYVVLDGGKVVLYFDDHPTATFEKNVLLVDKTLRATEYIGLGTGEDTQYLSLADLKKLLIFASAQPNTRDWPYFKSQLNVTKKVYMTLLNDGNYALIVDYGENENDENENPDSDNKGRVRVTGSLLINGEEAATRTYVDTELAKFDFIKVVASLEDVTDPLPNKIYLVPKTDSQNQDLFNEWIWVNKGTEEEPKWDWEWVTTKQLEVDLTPYAKNEDLSNTLNQAKSYVDAKILSGDKVWNSDHSLEIVAYNPMTGSQDVIFSVSKSNGRPWFLLHDLVVDKNLIVRGETIRLGTEKQGHAFLGKSDIDKLHALPEGDTIATKNFVTEKVAELVNSSPETLDTLAEVATALGHDPNFATTIMTMLGNKADKVSEDELNAMLAEVLA